MPHLRPEVLGGVRVAVVLAVAGGVGVCGVGDAARLLLARVVLPEDEHRVGIFGELGVQGEGNAGRVRQARRGGRCVHADAHHRLAAREAVQHAVQNRVQRLPVVEGMLAEARLGRRAGEALSPTRVRAGAGGEDLARSRVDKDGAGRVRPEVHTYYGLALCHFAFSSLNLPGRRQIIVRSLPISASKMVASALRSYQTTSFTSYARSTQRSPPILKFSA